MQSASSLQDIMDEMEETPPPQRQNKLYTVVVAGEFESGKSSLINMILRGLALPLNPGLPSRPVITIIEGKTPLIDAEDEHGITHRVRTPEDLVRVGRVARCLIRHPSTLLRGAEIIEVPSHHAHGISIDNLKRIERADRIVWTTIGSQAWRLSEKTVLEKLSPESRNKSVLAVTRADKLHSRDDLKKIAQRLKREAHTHFAEMVFVKASLDNILAAKDEDAWREAGGVQLAKSIFSARAAKQADEVPTP